MAGDEFQARTLDDLAEFRNGKALPTSSYSPNGKHPVFGANGQIDRTDQLLNAGPVIVVGRVGAYCGSVHQVSEPSWVTDNAIVATAKDGVDQRFLFYRLKSLDLRRTAIGSAQPLMTQGGLKVVATIVPPLPEQKAIAHILGTLDDKIELNRRMNETLEGMARALFKSWFVDFDPVRAKMDGRPVPGLDAATAALFPDGFEHVDGELVPRGWSFTTVKNICERITDGAHLSPPSVHEGRPMASVKDMDDWGIDVPGCRLISNEDFDALVANDCQPRLGDVLLAKDGAKCLETACEYQQPDSIVLLSSVAILRPKTLDASAYLHIWLCLESTKFYLREGFVSGSAIPRIVLRDLRHARLLYPAQRVMQRFNRVVRPLREQIWRNRDTSLALASLRDALLPKLLSGEIRVGAAEKIVEGVL